MNAGLKIRKAVADDAEGLQQCMAPAYAPYQVRMGEKRLPPMEADYRSEIENYPAWLVEAEERIIGGLIMDFDKGKASIANIAVHPDSQGLGIGGMLIAHAETIARAKGHAELFLATHVLLEENISLYRHLGWQETGRDESRVYMKKTL